MASGEWLASAQRRSANHSPLATPNYVAPLNSPEDSLYFVFPQNGGSYEVAY